MCNKKNDLKTVNTEDDGLIKKSGLGCGVDITGILGTNESIKTQIVDYNMLVRDGMVELDDSEESYNITRSGKNYTQMTENINLTLAGKIGFDLGDISFSRNLSSSFGKNTTTTDIYEYAETMVIRKMYALNFKPSVIDKLRNYIDGEAWKDINCTDAENPSSEVRLDKTRIKNVYKRYGTHVTTKTFYGCIYEYLMRREQNDWECTIERMIKMDTTGKLPIPETGGTGEVEKKSDFTDKEKECRQNSNTETTEHKYGGDTSIKDLDAWIQSCVKGSNNNCALLGYSLGINSSSDSGLIPLYELLEESDPRRAAMKEALQEYMNEYGFKAEQRNMVIVDAIAKRYSDGNAKPYFYAEDYNGVKRKYFRLEEDMYKHVKGITHGKMYFYYALGHLTDNAVVDMKFSGNNVDGDWKLRGVDSNNGVTGCLNDRYLAIKVHNVNNYPNPDDYVSGFGVKQDNKIKAISKGTEVGFNWQSNKDSENWYSGGLIHDDIKCIYTKDKLLNF